MIIISSEKMQILYLTIVLLAILLIYNLYRNLISGERTIKLFEILMGIIEAEDPNLEGHSLHVHNLTMLIYDSLPYKYRLLLKRRDLHYASLLLDIGKLGIPKEILERSGKLENHDWEIVKRHPDLGIDILKDIPGFVNVRSYILYHHERIDGKGYHQLTGDQIPLGAKIIAVADTYSAMTMNRSYRPSLSYGEAISELRHAAGSQLDEEIVEYFCKIPMDRVDLCLDDVRNKMQRFSDERKERLGI